MDNTKDLSKFGYRELREAARLLNAYCDEPSILDDGVGVEFNPNSGEVFLVDENYNVAMMNGETLEKWYNCPECGHEGFLEEMEHGEDNKDCVRYCQDIGAMPEEKVLGALL